jgi:hypothetical protein
MSFNFAKDQPGNTTLTPRSDFKGPTSILKALQVGTRLVWGFASMFATIPPA